MCICDTFYTYIAYYFQFRGLTRRLPQNIHVLTLEKLDNEQVLLRLEHFYEKNDDPYLAHPATVSLSVMNFDIFIICFIVVYFSYNICLKCERICLISLILSINLK